MRAIRGRVPQWLRDPMTRLGRHEAMLLVLLLLVVAGAWAFAELADEVVEGGTHAFDVAVLRSMRDPRDPGRGCGPAWLPLVMRDLTALGGYTVVGLVTLGVAGFLLVQRRIGAVALVLASTLGGGLASAALKAVFSRPRPTVVPRLTEVSSPSFPSGHAMLSAAVYFTLGAMLARLEKSWRTRAYLLLVASAVTLLVGISRVYLGVHYPTDVLGGWTAGLVWALLCWAAARALQRRGALENPGDGTQR
jgi:undecaprenyl-diphosphatase